MAALAGLINPILFASILDYARRVDTHIKALQSWYDWETGLYDSIGWWTSAEAVTVVIDACAVLPSRSEHAKALVANTFVQAQRYGPHGTPNFITDFYDDEGDWALLWIKAYDFTTDAKYLDMAETIFADLTKTWTATCGGQWWDRAHKSQGAIPTLLFLSTAAHLANRVPPIKKLYYSAWSIKIWEWFSQSGMLTPNNTIVSAINNRTCKPEGDLWAYVQGTAIASLLEMSILFHKSQDRAHARYLNIANEIAKAATTHLVTENGILRDPWESSACGPNGGQPKGMLIRNLQLLYEAVPEQLYKDFILKNADSILANDVGVSAKGVPGVLSLHWAGPFNATRADASTHSSALEALIAAAAIFCVCDLCEVSDPLLHVTPTISHRRRLFL